MTLLLVLVLTSVALLTWSVTLLVPWPLLALLRVHLLGRVLLSLLALLAWLVLLVLMRWLLPVAANVAVGIVVGVVGRRREVPVDNPERGDQDCHNENTCCWPADNPLHGVPTYHMLYTRLELTTVIVPATVAMGDAVAEFDSCSGPYSNSQ